MVGKHDAIGVVDFGGQYAHLIATKVRRAGVYAEIRQPEDDTSAFADYKGIILSGSPSLASHGEDDDWNKAILDLDVPILGFCFGHQEIAKRYGGTVVHGGREWGAATLHVKEEHPLFSGQPREQTVWMSHFDSVTELGPEFREVGYTTMGNEGAPHPNAAIASDSLRRYGFQYHPEVGDTEYGQEMIANFALKICGCAPTWSMDAVVDEQIAAIRKHVGDQSVFLLASGGVDSTVAAKLIAMALPEDRLKLLHVDNGMMRKGESAAVMKLLDDLGMGENAHFVDASEDFLNALGGEIEPEKKRHSIGQTFVDVFEREATRLGIEDHLLGQGTIYPDTVETGGTKRAHTIKTHHNRVPIIEQMMAAGRVIEPLADLYKVEVRELGEKLGIDREALYRHPFPGPGLGVRLLCSDGTVMAPPVGYTLNQELAAFGLSGNALPVRSVGVKADLRVYEHPVLLEGDGSFELFVQAAQHILGRVPDINRALWNLSGVAAGTIIPQTATMTRDRLDLLREADALVMDGLHRHGLYDTIWQCPTAMVPLQINGVGSELVIVRPVLSERAMSARPAPLPPELLEELRSEIMALPKVTGFALDLTSKPPGTIEWE